MDDAELEEKKMPLLDHLIELRNRLVYAVIALAVGFGICWMFREEIFFFLVRPLAELLGPERRMIFTNLTEAFFTYIKVSFWAGAFLSFPIVAGQFWAFVAPGLYKNEKRAFLPFLIATPVLFFLGGAMVYYFVMPVAWQFLLSFETTQMEGMLPIQLEARVGEYLSLVMTLIFAFGVAFQMPVLLTLLVRAGLASADALASKRRYAIVIIFVLAAILTPPDPASQIGLALPMILLYEVSIWIARSIERKRAEREAAEDADNAAQPTA